jgi:hypothetical protein
MGEIPAQTNNLPKDQLLVVICHMALAVKWSSTFSETPALTTQSTLTGASMPGLAMSTYQCRAIDSVHPKWK